MLTNFQFLITYKSFKNKKTYIQFGNVFIYKKLKQINKNSNRYLIIFNKFLTISQPTMLHNRSPSYPQHIPIPEIIIKQLQTQQQQLSRIKQQQQTISSIDENIKKKNQQILYLKQQLDKYHGYYKKYSQLVYQYNDKLNKLAQKEKQLNILMKQVEDLIQQNDSLQGKLMSCEQQRSHLLKQQHQIERVNNQIQQTFNLYQEQCRKKEMGLLRDLQKAYKQITQLNKRIDGYEMKMFQNEELKKKLSQKINQQSNMTESIKQQQKLAQSNKDLESISIKNLTELKNQNQQLKYLLSTKQDELTKYKILNHQLSIEFDKSVSKICDFERQLTKYRQQNHELQKMLNLFVQKEKHEKIHLRQLQKVNLRKNQSSNYPQEIKQRKYQESDQKHIDRENHTEEDHYENQ